MTARSPLAVVALAAAVAVVANLGVYAAGRAAGGDFTFTDGRGATQTVDAVTVAGFTAVPLLVGLAAAALLGRRWPVLVTVAMVVAPVLALATIAVMTIPVDLDTASTVALAACHVVLVPVSLVALTLLRPIPVTGADRSGTPTYA